MFRQRNLEKLPIALDYDDYRIRRFTGSCQFESDPLGLLQGRGGIRKFLTEVVLEYRRSAPEMKIVARHGLPGPSRNIRRNKGDRDEIQTTQKTADRARQRRLGKRKCVRFRNGAQETAMSQFGS